MSKDSPRLPEDNQAQLLASLQRELEKTKAELAQERQRNLALQNQLTAAQDRVRALQLAPVARVERIAEAVRTTDRYNINRVINIDEFRHPEIHPLTPRTLDFIIKLSNEHKPEMTNGGHLEYFLTNTKNYSAANEVYDQTTDETWLMQTIRSADNLKLIAKFFVAATAKDHLEVNKKNKAGETALFYAVRRMLNNPKNMKQSTAIVEYILDFTGHIPDDHIADIELANNEGKTILDLAIEEESGTGRTQVFKFLISKYSREALVRMGVEEKPLTTKMRRILEEHKTFLNENPNMNAELNRRRTHFAEGPVGRIATEERIASLKKQILGREEVTPQSDLKNNHSILDYMHDVGTKETLLMLWAKTPNFRANIYVQFDDQELCSQSINEQDINGDTALHHAVSEGYTTDTNRIEFLLKLSPDLTIRNNKNETVWDIVKNGRYFFSDLKERIERETLRQEEAKKSAVAPAVGADITQAAGAPEKERNPMKIDRHQMEGGAPVPQELIDRLARARAERNANARVVEKAVAGASPAVIKTEGMVKAEGSAAPQVIRVKPEGVKEEGAGFVNAIKRERDGSPEGSNAQRRRT